MASNRSVLESIGFGSGGIAGSLGATEGGGRWFAVTEGNGGGGGAGILGSGGGGGGGGISRDTGGGKSGGGWGMGRSFTWLGTGGGGGGFVPGRGIFAAVPRRELDVARLSSYLIGSSGDNDCGGLGTDPFSSGGLISLAVLDEPVSMEYFALDVCNSLSCPEYTFFWRCFTLPCDCVLLALRLCLCKTECNIFVYSLAKGF